MGDKMSRRRFDAFKKADRKAKWKRGGGGKQKGRFRFFEERRSKTRIISEDDDEF